MRVEEEREGSGGMICIGTASLLGAVVVSFAILSNARCLMTPAKEPHCCRSSAASDAMKVSIQS